MKNSKKTGSIVILIGILILFQKVETHCGFGGCFDDSLDILFSSMMIMIVGIFFFYIKNLNTIWWKILSYILSFSKHIT